MENQTETSPKTLFIVGIIGIIVGAFFIAIGFIQTTAYYPPIGSNMFFLGLGGICEAIGMILVPYSFLTVLMNISDSANESNEELKKLDNLDARLKTLDTRMQILDERLKSINM